MKREYVYTVPGLQRPIFLGEGKDARFVLDVGDGEACVMVSYDPVEVVAKGKGMWEKVEAEGGVYGVTAVRVGVKRVVGWCVLRVEESARC
ncbi:MAG: hypothetical protein WAZ18_06455 [Alphaproteobacteria bacterium]